MIFKKRTLKNSILWVVGCFICSSVLLVAKEQHLVYDGDADIYELIYDDNRISVADMQEIWWLSPWVGEPPVGPFNIGISERRSPSGDDMVDKVFMAPGLESCEPGLNCGRDSRKADAAFLENAARNLRAGDKQVKRLRSEKLPPVLEPVRSYLLLHLQLSLEREKARYQYLKSGDFGPMRNLLCACSCGQPEEAFFQQLITTSEFSTRLELTSRWRNQALECEWKLHPPEYPLDSWKRFLNDFGIIETRRFKRID